MLSYFRRKNKWNKIPRDHIPLRNQETPASDSSDPSSSSYSSNFSPVDMSVSEFLLPSQQEKEEAEEAAEKSAGKITLRFFFSFADTHIRN